PRARGRRQCGGGCALRRQRHHRWRDGGDMLRDRRGGGSRSGVVSHESRVAGGGPPALRAGLDLATLRVATLGMTILALSSILHPLSAQRPALLPAPTHVSFTDDAFRLGDTVAIAIQPATPRMREIAGLLASSLHAR